MRTFTVVSNTLGNDKITLFLNQITAIKYKGYISELEIYLNDGSVVSIQYFEGSNTDKNARDKAKENVEECYEVLINFVESDNKKARFNLVDYADFVMYKDTNS